MPFSLLLKALFLPRASAPPKPLDSVATRRASRDSVAPRHGKRPRPRAHAAPCRSLNSTYATHAGAIHSSEDDTRAALRALELAAVERDAQAARLGVQLQHAREDTERARAEATQARAETHEARGQVKEAEVQLAALSARYERAKGWRAVNHKGPSSSLRLSGRKIDLEGRADREDASPSRSSEQACTGGPPDSGPDPSRSPVVITARFNRKCTRTSLGKKADSGRRAAHQAPFDAGGAPRITPGSAPVSRSFSGASAADPRLSAPRPMPLPSRTKPNTTAFVLPPASAPIPTTPTPPSASDINSSAPRPMPLPLPSRSKMPSVPIPTADRQAANTHTAHAHARAAVKALMSMVTSSAPTSSVPMLIPTPILKPPETTPTPTHTPVLKPPTAFPPFPLDFPRTPTPGASQLPRGVVVNILICETIRTR
ncbi:hypothetical protein FB451DRAFT_1534377 [Mycena latifolia]|nr:hypothetical protein FB451DRAFT_1534377 [Mycena latifolia]